MTNNVISNVFRSVYNKRMEIKAFYCGPTGICGYKIVFNLNFVLSSTAGYRGVYSVYTYTFIQHYNTRSYAY